MTTHAPSPRPLLALPDALAVLLAQAQPLTKERAALADLLRRVLAEPIVADADVPAFDRAAMDGIAVVAEGLLPGAVLTQVGISAAGRPFAGELRVGECVRIMTGGVVPAGATAVVPVERITVQPEGVRVLDSVRPEQHIARQGSEVRRGETVLDPGIRLQAAHLGVLATYGRHEAWVARRPRVAVVPTGDELVPVTATPTTGQVRDANRHAIAGLVAPEAEVTQYPVAPDTREGLAQALAAAWDQADLLITSGGVSAGDFDLVPPVLQSLGATVHFHQVAIKPGKPLLFGTREHGGRRQYCLGLPGNPVSSFVCCALFALPLLRALTGAPADWSFLQLPSHTALPAVGPRTEILPAHIISQNGQSHAQVWNLGSSADLTRFSAATWLAWRPAHAPALAAGDLVTLLAWPRPGV